MQLIIDYCFYNYQIAWLESIVQMKHKITTHACAFEFICC